METGVLLQQVPSVRLDRDAGFRRAEFQRELYARGYAGAHVHILCIGRESGRCHHEVISVERHVGETKAPIAASGGLTLISAYAIGNLDLGSGNHSTRGIFYHSLYRPSVPQLPTARTSRKKHHQSQNKHQADTKTLQHSFSIPFENYLCFVWPVAAGKDCPSSRPPPNPTQHNAPPL